MDTPTNVSRDEKVLCRLEAQKGLCVVFLILFFFLAAAVGSMRTVHAAGESAAEARIIKFVKEIYPGGDTVRVRLTTVPPQLREKVKIVNLSFVRIPDVSGDGVCSVEIETAPGRLRTVQVPFRVFAKRELYVLKGAGQKGDTIGQRDVVVRETFMNGKGAGYPASIEDVVGKVLKRDVPANTLVTNQILEDRIVVRQGETVTIIAETDRLIVRAKGKTVDRGRVGDVIRVRNIASGKEVVAKVVNGSSVKVEF
jgi:flagella basal body P-ring formation protein FlgA